MCFGVQLPLECGGPGPPLIFIIDIKSRCTLDLCSYRESEKKEFFFSICELLK